MVESRKTTPHYFGGQVVRKLNFQVSSFPVYFSIFNLIPNER